jgi:preprotein translocase subunit YajC
MQLLLPVLLLGVMYMLLIRPQQQRVRRQRALVSSLEVGDRIVTIGGMVGEVIRLDDETADIKVAGDVVITFLRPAINRKYEEVEPIDLDVPDTPEIPETPEAGA